MTSTCYNLLNKSLKFSSFSLFLLILSSYSYATRFVLAIYAESQEPLTSKYEILLALHKKKEYTGWAFPEVNAKEEISTQDPDKFKSFLGDLLPQTIYNKYSVDKIEHIDLSSYLYSSKRNPSNNREKKLVLVKVKKLHKEDSINKFLNKDPAPGGRAPAIREYIHMFRWVPADPIINNFFNNKDIYLNWNAHIEDNSFIKMFCSFSEKSLSYEPLFELLVNNLKPSASLGDSIILIDTNVVLMPLSSTSRYFTNLSVNNREYEVKKRVIDQERGFQLVFLKNPVIDSQTQIIERCQNPQIDSERWYDRLKTSTNSWVNLEILTEALETQP